MEILWRAIDRKIYQKQKYTSKTLLAQRISKLVVRQKNKETNLIPTTAIDVATR